MFTLKSIQNAEREFDRRAERFLWRRPFLGFLWAFVGAPILVLICVCAGSLAISLPILWLSGWM